MRSRSKQKQSKAPTLQQQKSPGSSAPPQSLAAPPASSAGSALERLLQRYIDPGLDDTARDAVAASVRQQLDDPWSVARSAVLPSGHPLKVQAGVVCEAFTRIAEGDTTSAVLSPLSQIPRRSPFAPYVLALRAMHALYSGELEQARQLAAAVGEDSPAGKLGRAVRALAGEPVENPTKALRRLMAISGGKQSLGERLALLDKAFSESTHHHAARLLEALMRDLKRDRSRLVRPVREEAARRWVKLDWPPPALYGALALEFDTPERAQLSAIALEASMPADGARFWIDFAESPGMSGPDRALVLARAAELIQRDPDFCSECGVVHGTMEGSDLNTAEKKREFLKLAQRAGVQDGMPIKLKQMMEAVLNGDLILPDEAPDDTLDPLELLEEARTLDPQPETFAQRLKLLEEYGTPKERESELELWASAHPTDIRPLIQLAELARIRGASRQALDYIQRAEAQDTLNPDVKLQKLRLLLNSAVRRLKQKRPHLVGQDLFAMKALVGVPEEVRLPLIAGLELLASRPHPIARGTNTGGTNTGGTTARTPADDVVSLARFTGDPGSAYVLLAGLCDLTGHTFPAVLPAAIVSHMDLQGIVTGISRFTLFHRMLEIPPKGISALFSLVLDFLPKGEPPKLPVPASLVLAETALTLDFPHVSNLFSGDSLLMLQGNTEGAGGKLEPTSVPTSVPTHVLSSPLLAAVLLHRGRALMRVLEVRRAVGCLRAAFTLARRQGDSITQRLALQALQTGLGTSPRHTGAGHKNLEPISDEELKAVLTTELQSAAQTYRQVPNRSTRTSRATAKKGKGNKLEQLDIPF